MKNRPLTVGNRVTYEWNEKIYQEIMVSNNDIDIFKEKCKKLGYKILNVEALPWEKIDFEKEIKEKKLFTEDEEEFLKSMIKWYNISTIEFTGTEILLKENGRIVCNPDYPENMKFENIKKYKYYTLKELGLEV